MSDERLRTPPAERFDAESLSFDLPAELTRLRNEGASAVHGHRQKTLYKHAGRTVALFSMEPGGELAEHSADGVVTIQPLEGELSVVVAGRGRTLAVGDLLTLAPGTPHAVRSDGESAFLLQVSLGA